VVREVAGAADVEAALALAGAAGRGDPGWVEPELGSMRRLLTRRSAYCRHAGVRPLIGFEGGRPVATVTAFADPRNGDGRERVGTLGLFEAVPGAAEAVDALLAEGLAGLRAWGAAAVLAPQNGHQNNGFGLLVADHGVRQLDGLGYQPPYYRAYLEDAGFREVHRYAAFTIALGQPRVQAAVAAAIAAVPDDVRIVPAGRWRFRAAVERFADLHSRAFVGVWGDTPIHADEAWEELRRARLAIPTGFFLFAEVERRPVGFALCLPDLGQLWRPAAGEPARRALVRRRRVSRGGIYAIGVVPEARRRGVAAGLMATALGAMRRRGFREAVYALVLDDNAPSRALATRFGGQPRWSWALLERRPT
jgi:ribosomal protein S18 acetylase RimI-like enzyme